MRFDLPQDELERYHPAVREPADFDQFWASTLVEARAVDRPAVLTPWQSALRTVDVADVSFAGFAGDEVHAWYLRPTGQPGPLPLVVEYLGYGGGRGLPQQHLNWASAGYAHLVMETRGQGATWASGAVTADPHGAMATVPGYLTRGIETAENYYYRRVMTDAVRLVDVGCALPGVDPRRIVVAGGSQGGGITLAVAGLRDDLAAALVDVPFLCHFERAVEITDRKGYVEISDYLAAQRGQADAVFTTLSYVDGANFAARARTPALFSVALGDMTCPPSTVYAAYNRYGGPKQMTVYPYNDHEGGGPEHWDRQTAFLAETLSSAESDRLVHS